MAQNIRIRKDLVVAVLAVAGAVLGGCSSNEATYRPAPATTKAPSTYQTPTYTQPTQPTYTAPTAPRPAAPPQMACGKGKCG